MHHFSIVKRQMTEIQVSVDITVSCIQECPIRTAERPTLAPERNILVSLFGPHLAMVLTDCKNEVKSGRNGY